MSTRKLLVLLGIFVGIVLIGLISKLIEPAPPGIAVESGYVSLAPAEFLIADVAWFEVWRESKPEDKLVINRKDGVWTVGSRFDVPADTAKVDKFLEIYKNLMGTVRSTDEAILAEYGLDKEALHLKVVSNKEGTEATEILIGKGSKFVRKNDQSTVYAVKAEFNTELGIYGDDSTDSPDASRWLKKEILAMDKEDITKLEITYPDKKLVFEKVARDVPKPEVKEGEETPPPAPQEFEWKITSAAPEGLTAKTKPADRILTRLAALSCADAADPARAEEWGLASPAYVLTATRGDGTQVVIKAGMPDPDGDGYAMVSEAGDHIYKIGNYNLKSLFPKGSDLFDGLPKNIIAKETVTGLTVTLSSGEAYTIAKNGEEGDVTVPAVALETDRSKTKEIFNGLAGLRLEDYAAADAAPGVTGLDAPAATIAVASADGTKTITVGKRSATSGGYYLRFDGMDTVYTADKYNVEKIMPALSDLLQDKLLELNPADVEQVRIESAGSTVLLVRDAAGAWRVTEDDSTGPADKGLVMDYLQNYSPLNVAGVSLKEGDKPLATISLKLPAGEKVICLKGSSDSGITLTVSDLSGVYTVDTPVYERLSATFMKFVADIPPAPVARENRAPSAPAVEAPAVQVVE